MNNERLIYAVVPVKDPASGKSRLASVLDAVDRRALCASLARHTLRTCAAAFGPARTIVVTASAEIADFAGRAGIPFVHEADEAGLNAALALGADRAQREGAGALLVVPTDLPLLTKEALHAVADALPGGAGVVLVPDRHESGTNVMALAPARKDLFAFGEGSFRRHASLARQAGCDVRIHRDKALGLDLDLAEDYFAWTGRRRTLEAGQAA